MADFDSHIKLSISNLQFLQMVNSHSYDRYDWQVTICFYTAVHLINGHLAKSQDIHHRTHEDVKNAISPTNQLSICKIDENPFVAYMILDNLSRRARYLVCDDMNDRSTKAHFTSEKYFAKAVRNLDLILSYFANKYNLEITPIKLNCSRLKGESLVYFRE